VERPCRGLSSLKAQPQTVQILTSNFKRELTLRFPFGILRPLLAADIHPGYVAGLNDPEVNRFLVNVRKVRQTATSVIEFVEQNLLAPDAILFGIWFQGDTLHCGTVRLHNLGLQQDQARIGICVFDRRRWGKGVGTSALKTVSEWACGTLGVSAVEAGVYAENMASQKIFVAAGYEWRKDVADTYERDGRPTTVRFYRFPGPGQPSSGVPPQSG